jgi:tRNA pseudouridine(38-40) synthase
VTVTGASRTDAGVHARGQVASFHTERTIPLRGIRRGLNAMLLWVTSAVAGPMPTASRPGIGQVGRAPAS